MLPREDAVPYPCAIDSDAVATTRANEASGEEVRKGGPKTAESARLRVQRPLVGSSVVHGEPI